MSDSNSNNIKTGWVLAILVGIVLLVMGFYFFNFNFHILKNENWSDTFKNLSKNTGSWGTFGDYVGGILNPVIAAFAFYLIAKTYELQKKELEATRSLLEVSTDAQKNQIKLAALTSLLNSVLMRIDILKSERLSLLQGVPLQPMKPDGGSALPTNPTNPIIKQLIEQEENRLNSFLPQWIIENRGTPEGRRFVQIESEIELLAQKSAHLEDQIEFFANNQVP